MKKIKFRDDSGRIEKIIGDNYGAVRNYFENGKWGKAEKISFPDFKFPSKKELQAKGYKVL